MKHKKQKQNSQQQNQSRSLTEERSPLARSLQDDIHHDSAVAKKQKETRITNKQHKKQKD